MYRIGQAAVKLDVSPAQIQRWTRDFADWLSGEATSVKRGPHGHFLPRRYNDADIAILQRIQQWQNEGVDNAEIVASLTAEKDENAVVQSDEFAAPNGAHDDAEDDAIRLAFTSPNAAAAMAENEVLSGVESDVVALFDDEADDDDPASALTADDTAFATDSSIEDVDEDVVTDTEPPSSNLARLNGQNALQLLHDTLDSHQALVAAQQQQIELLATMREQAGTLKSENSQLRKRLRMMEEQMTRLKESDWNHRLTLEERMAQLEEELAQATAKRSWWQRLMGR